MDKRERLTVRFEENGDIVFDKVPDDMMAEIKQRAAACGLSPSEEVRDTIMPWAETR